MFSGRIRILLIVAVCSLIGFSEIKAHAETWPEIEPFNKSFTFISRNQMFLHFPIVDRAGKELYFVECASPFADDERVKQYAYSRDFECRVALPDATLLPNIQLLALNSKIDKEWQSRGGFWWSELVSACSTNPDWGAVRVYRFRGMRLKIQLSDIKMKEVEHPSKHQPNFELETLKVDISGSVDLNAEAAYGGRSTYSEPPPIDAEEPYGYQNCVAPHRAQ
jgi:hypothetical protein